MWKHAASIASMGASLAKRSAEENPPQNGKPDLPISSILIVLAVFVAYIPLALFISYTLGRVCTTLAIIEDPSPPAYEPVSLQEDVESNPNKLDPPNVSGQPQMLTTSLRSMWRLLYSIGGYKSFYRGFACFFAIIVSNIFMETLFRAVPFVPSILGSLIADLALVQLHTAWVHIVISQPSDLPFYRRLPPFKKTFEATSLPIFVLWIASVCTIFLPMLVAQGFSLKTWNPATPNHIPTYETKDIGALALVLLMAFAFFVFALIPAYAVLIRVQASLLPPGEDPIVPFDRSFGGSVDPAIVGGPGYVSWKDAWKTMSRASWIRVYKVCGKVFAVDFIMHFVLAFVALMTIMVVGAIAA